LQGLYVFATGHQRPQGPKGLIVQFPAQMALPDGRIKYWVAVGIQNLKKGRRGWSHKTP
jgi:hypothetical protein